MNRKSFVRKTLWILTLAPFVSASLIAQAEFIDLGGLGVPAPAVPTSEGLALSADGSVVVGGSKQLVSPFLLDVPFRWHAATGMVGLGTSPNWVDGRATVVSPDGATVVGVRRENHLSPIADRPFRWNSATGQVALPAFGRNTIVSITNGMEVAFGNEFIGDAYRWTQAGGFDPITSANGFPFVILEDGSDDGLAAVGTVFDFNGEYSVPFYWTVSGGPVHLPVPSGWEVGLGTAISADGQTMVGYLVDSTGAGIGSFRWTPSGGMSGLGPGGAFVDGRPIGVSADGQTIVGNASYAFLWTPALGVVDLAEHLISLGAVIPPNFGASGRLTVTGVSADGNVLVGTRDLYDSGLQAWIERAWIAYLSPAGPVALGESYCAPTAPNSTGQLSQLDASGSEVATDDAVLLTGSQLPSQVFGLLLNGSAQDMVSNPGGSQGTLCLGGSLGRYNDLVAQSDSVGTLPIEISLPNTPTPGAPVPILAGQTWYFQLWHRDMNPGPTSNLTNGVEIVFQ